MAPRAVIYLVLPACHANLLNKSSSKVKQMLGGEAGLLPRVLRGCGWETNYQLSRELGYEESQQNSSPEGLHAAWQRPVCDNCKYSLPYLAYTLLEPMIQRPFIHLASLVNKAYHISTFLRSMQLSDKKQPH